MRVVVLGLNPPKSHFDVYGVLARAERSPTIQAGRYAGQAAAERLILADIEPKLALGPSHSLLEIGCGPGNLLIPLAFRVARATGIDHPEVIARARERCRDASIEFKGGFFPDVAIEGHFDRILIYGVIAILPDWPTLQRFLDAAVNLLATGGRLLVGDIPNSDRKKRFLDSEAGKQFDAAWKRSMAEAGKSAAADPFAAFAGTASIGTLDDKAILGLLERYRARGYHAYIVPQRSDLPFGHTREDILIERL